MDVVSNTDVHPDRRAGWEADTVRLSLFADSEWPPSLMDILMDRPAEVEQTSKRGSLLTRLETLTIDRWQVNIVAQPGRLDVHMLVAQFAGETDVVKPAAEFRELWELAGRNAGELAPFSRVGVGASLIQRRADKAATYSAINSRFPCLGIDPDNSDDFTMQVNRLSGEAEGRVNRIERWSYGLFERVDLSLLGGMATVGPPTARLEGVRLDLDYNTAIGTGTAFDKERTKEITLTLIKAVYEKLAE